MTDSDTNQQSNQMGESTSVKIEFPCEAYPIKIVGEASLDYESLVLATVEEHAPGFDRTTVSVRNSKNGRYQSVTVQITATGETQLKAMFEDLKQHPQVRMVL